MTDELEKEEKETPTIDPKALAESISKSVEDKVLPSISALESKLAKKEAKEEELDLGDDDDDEDDAFVSKKDLKEFFKKMQKEVTDTSRRVTGEVLNEKNVKASRDQEAFKEFPMLDTGSSQYNPEFAKAVKEEIKAKLSRGRSQEDPDLIYDSAAAVKATSPKFWKSSDELAQDEARRLNNKEGSFDVRGKGKNDRNAPTARQLEYAKKLGLSTEYFTKNYKRFAHK